jgi:hypothetical protein
MLENHEIRLKKKLVSMREVVLKETVRELRHNLAQLNLYISVRNHNISIQSTLYSIHFHIEYIDTQGHIYIEPICNQST